MKVFAKYSVPLSIAIISLFLTQCGTGSFYVTPPDLESRFLRDSTVAALGKYFNGKTIFLDPGHGGDDRSHTGPEKKLVEADVNLEVALSLRDFLKRAGANVIMSREADRSVPLEARSEQANINKADLFVSIHHNATQDSYTNYTATFYHALSGQQGYQPSSHDLARYIQRDLSYVLDNPGPLASFDGTMSDYRIYPEEGFSVLRKTTMTGVLVECSFLSSAYEEQRLADPAYNQIEAWGIFRGIGKYLHAGIPVLSYHSASVFEDNQPSFQLKAVDPAGIDDQSVRITIDGREQGFLFDKQTGDMTVNALMPLAPGYHELAVQVRNNNGNSSFPFSVFFSIGTPAAAFRTSVTPPSVPPDERAYSFVRIEAVDSSGLPCADATPIRFRTSQGVDTMLLSQDGFVSAYINPLLAEPVTFTASNGPLRATGTVHVDSGATYSRGLVMSSDGKPVRYAEIQIPDGSFLKTNAMGEYIISGRRTDGLEVLVRANGYFAKREAFRNQLVQDPIVMTPVARGVLRDKRYFLECIAATGIPIASEEESSRIDVRTAAYLAKLLEASGAEVVNLSALSPEERTRVLASGCASVIQVCADPQTTRTWFRRTASNKSIALTAAMIDGLKENSGIETRTWASRIHSTNEYPEGFIQTAVYVPMPGKQTYPEQQIAVTASDFAWGLYTGILGSLNYRRQGTKQVEVTVSRKADMTPAPYAEVLLNHALPRVTDEKGMAVFPAVSIDEDDVFPMDADTYQISGIKTEILK